VESLKAGRELDTLIAEKVMGLDIGDDCDHSIDSCLCFPPYSTDIAAAWQVVDKLISAECGFVVSGGGSLPWLATFRNGQAHAETAPLAICLAALKAVGYEVKESE